MAYPKITISALVLLFGLAASYSSNKAFAADDRECFLLGKKVAAAAANATGDKSEAEAERKQGHEFCLHGFYREGMDRYQKALILFTK